jgi:hypothetical protein
MNFENKTTSPNKPSWTFDIVVVISILALIAFGFYVASTQPKHGVKVIDCSLAEISPDFTSEMKEACRKARSGRI